MLSQFFERFSLNQYDSDEDSLEQYTDYDDVSFPEDKASRQLLVLHPRDIKGMEVVAEYAKKGNPMILSLEQAPTEVHQRVLDYCQGLCAALDMTMESVSDFVYVIASEHVAVSSMFCQDESSKKDWL